MSERAKANTLTYNIEMGLLTDYLEQRHERQCFVRVVLLRRVEDVLVCISMY